MTQVLNILNHFKYCFLRNITSDNSKFTFDRPININTQNIKWEKVLSDAYDIASLDKNLKEIIEEEEFEKNDFIK